MCEEISGRQLEWSLSDQARIGDHRWWVSGLDDFKRDYPGWSLTRGIRDTLQEIYDANAERWQEPAVRH
jgi:CDP-paratose 2-epimerase